MCIFTRAADLRGVAVESRGDMKIEVEIPAVLETTSPYGLNVGEAMRVRLSKLTDVFATIIRLSGEAFLIVNPWTGTSVHVSYNMDPDTESDIKFAERTGERLPPGTVLKFTL